LRTNRPASSWLAVAAVAWLLAGLAACSSAQATAASSGSSCGTTRTGANVPVVIKVARGTVDCATALRVEQGYTAMIKAGDVPGNGGGAPVTVDGWTCQGYPTPQVLRTRDASQCHTTSAEVVAVLAPSSADRASTGS
jgi:hypothetical protein